MAYKDVIAKMAWTQFLSEYTQIEIGEKTGKKNNTISTILSGKNKMDVEFLIDFCAICDVRVSWIVGESPPVRELERVVSEKIKTKQELTIKMKRAKAGTTPKQRNGHPKRKQVKVPEPTFTVLPQRLPWREEIRQLSERVQSYLRTYPTKHDAWIAEQCSVLPSFVRLERHVMKLKNMSNNLS